MVKYCKKIEQIKIRKINTKFILKKSLAYEQKFAAQRRNFKIGSQKHMENHYFHHKIAQKASTKLRKIASGGVALKTTQNNGYFLFNYRIAAKWRNL